jgi:hypothetical protein
MLMVTVEAKVDKETGGVRMAVLDVVMDILESKVVIKAVVVMVVEATLIVASEIKLLISKAVGIFARFVKWPPKKNMMMKKKTLMNVVDV